ncbi:hypothetical protein LR48_Vigan09g095000 [Vigna angularis]|uniref:Uncharacterized protein n=1 Tax=Phaseolus angularis TaxID=3914 RepID=A0A0L9VB46_PHAAN|nr:hypothetical protein LR48_Vigan09g095000 [Vigna angularis]
MFVGHLRNFKDVGFGTGNFTGADDAGDIALGTGDFPGDDVGDETLGTGDFTGINDVGDETLGTGDFTGADDVGDETLRIGDFAEPRVQVSGVSGASGLQSKREMKEEGVSGWNEGKN